MRNTIFSMLGLLGMLLLALPALLSANRPEGAFMDHCKLNPFWSTVSYMPTRAVAGEEATEQQEGNVSDEEVSEPPAASQAEEPAPVNTTGANRGGQERKKKIQIDLSDLVIKPV